jgi:hypothetical protein
MTWPAEDGASAQDEEEGGLARAAGALDGDVIGTIDVEIDAVEAPDRPVRTGEFADDSFAADHSARRVSAGSWATAIMAGTKAASAAKAGVRTMARAASLKSGVSERAVSWNRSGP